MSQRIYRGLISHVISRMKAGESATFTMPLKIGKRNAGQEFSSMLASYAARRGPDGATWGYESFTALTAQQRPIVGVIVTRKT